MTRSPSEIAARAAVTHFSSDFDQNPVWVRGWCRSDIGISPKSSQRRCTRGCRILDLRDLDSRNERIRIIAFQNIKNFRIGWVKIFFRPDESWRKFKKFRKSGAIWWKFRWKSGELVQICSNADIPTVCDHGNPPLQKVSTKRLNFFHLLKRILFAIYLI